MLSGIATAANVNPARRSVRSHDRWYPSREAGTNRCRPDGLVATGPDMALLGGSRYARPESDRLSVGGNGRSPHGVRLRAAGAARWGPRSGPASLGNGADSR